MTWGRAHFEAASAHGPHMALQHLATSGQGEKRLSAGPPRDILDYTLFIPCVWMLSGLGVYLRMGGTAIVLGLVAVLVTYAVLRRSPPPLWLTLYFIFCIAAAIASLYRLFPASWQIYFRDESVVRQLGPIISIFATAWAANAYFRRRLLAGDAFSGSAIILFLAFVVAPIIMFQQGFVYEGDDTTKSTIAMYGSFTNNIIIALFFVTAAAYCGTGWRRKLGIAALLTIAGITHFAQYRVMIMGALIILLGGPARLVTLALLSALIGLYMAGLFFIPQIMLESPNTGIRLAFILDAFKSLYDTYGLGIGYGTESVRWTYYFPGRPLVTFLPDPNLITPGEMLEVLSTGVHNSFIQALLRTGLIGFALLLMAFAAVFPRRTLPRPLRNHAAIMFTIITIACFVNPALESPIQGMGVGFAYGYLLALRNHDRWHSCPPRRLSRCFQNARQTTSKLPPKRRTQDVRLSFADLRVLLT